MKRWRALFIGAVLLSASTAQAAPYWGTFQLDQCTSIGYRQSSAILWGIPLGASWETTCANTPATINGIYYASPSRCVNTGTNMWGEFDVPDSSCTPYWGAFQQDACQRRGVRQYSAVIENVQPDISWETACWSTPASPAGQYFASPARCVNTGLNMWGQWDVTDSGCLPYWGTISAAACKYGTLGVRTFSAILWNIPPGETWEDACSIQPATVNGTYFASPARCVNTSLNMWGEWDLPDTTCNPYWGPFQDEGWIVTLGRYSMGLFLLNAKISSVHGQALQSLGRLIVPMYHPAAALHQGSLKPVVESDFAKLPQLIAKAGEAPKYLDEEPEEKPQPKQLNLF